MSHTIMPSVRSGRLPYLIPLAMMTVLALLMLGACGTDDDTQGEPAAVGAEVTVSGAFGETTIEGTPERVLALSPQDADFVMELGVTPVAIPVYPDTLLATDGTGIWPWQREALEGEEPTQLQLAEDTAQVTEQIVELDPDLIVATGFWGLTEEIYNRLEAVAPVVHYDTMANGEPWQDSQRKIGAALGLGDEADQAVAETEERIKEVREANPGFGDITYNAVIGDMNNQLYVLAAEDRGIGMLLRDMGLELDEDVRDLPTDEDGRGLLSYEEIPRLDADVVFVISPNGDTEYLTDQPAWSETTAAREGNVVSLPRSSGVPSAAGFPSPLSIRWCLDQFTSLINEVGV